jgi:hypothetical protein
VSARTAAGRGRCLRPTEPSQLHPPPSLVHQLHVDKAAPTLQPTPTARLWRGASDRERAQRSGVATGRLSEVQCRGLRLCPGPTPFGSSEDTEHDSDNRDASTINPSTAPLPRSGSTWKTISIQSLHKMAKTKNTPDTVAAIISSQNAGRRRRPMIPPLMIPSQPADRSLRRTRIMGQRHALVRRRPPLSRPSSHAGWTLLAAERGLQSRPQRGCNRHCVLDQHCNQYSISTRSRLSCTLPALATIGRRAEARARIASSRPFVKPPAVRFPARRW